MTAILQKFKKFWPVGGGKKEASEIPLPPNELQFVGDGDFERIGQNYVRHFIRLCGLKPYERVLDVGCGIGRMAIPLTMYLKHEGTYEGFDIVKKGIDWCAQEITSRYSNFCFQHVDVHNQAYYPNAFFKSNEYTFPYSNESFDFIFLTSVFTHMLPDGLENYLSEVSRVLKKGGRCFITFFLLNKESLEAISEGKAVFDFKHVLGPFRCVDEQNPENALAYDEEYVINLYRSHGLSIQYPIYYGSWSGRMNYLEGQDIVIAYK